MLKVSSSLVDLHPAFSPRRLVVFDLDGTLYRQRPMRIHMAAMLVADALRRRDFSTARLLAVYRRQRETLAEARERDFEPLLLARTAAVCGVGVDEVRQVVTEWMLERPLPHLPTCRMPGVDALFSALRASGVVIGVLSDYPAASKLKALGLTADLVVSAHDPEVSVQKPDPAGLEHLVAVAGCHVTDTILIGDRPDRDGVAASELGVAFLQVARRQAAEDKGKTAFVRDLADPRLTALYRGAR
jgi:FMN phosphatase YigB (HAD superfamily)